MDHIISIAERSGEFGGHLGINLSLNVGPCSHVGIYLSLKRAFIIFFGKHHPVGISLFDIYPNPAYKILALVYMRNC